MDPAHSNVKHGVLNSYHVLLSLLFAALIAVTMAFVYGERTNTLKAEIDHFSQVFARDLSEALRLSVENLRSASNAFIFFDDMDYEQFQDVTARSFNADPGLLIIEWQPVVPGDEREQFVNRARRRGLPDFRLWEPDASGNPVSASTRSEHVPVLFMRSRDPAGTAISTLGLDLAWSPERMQSKWEARDTGRARASALFHVITGQSTDFKPLGFAITLPVYRRGFVPPDVDQRRAELIGYVAGVYSLEDVIRTPIREIVALGFNIEIRDAEHERGDGGYRLLVEAGTPSGFETELVLGLFGNQLHLRLRATADFVRDQFSALWLVLPGAVFLFGLLTFIFLTRLEKSNRQLSSAQKALTALNDRLEHLSQHDPLTGVYNRRAFLEKTRQELDRIDRHQASLALLMLDLDRFKEINDGWGHKAGDTVLVEFTRICQQATRNIDMIARLGGEEFAILLSNSNREQAFQFSERLREQVASRSVALEDYGADVRVTVSIGFSVTDRKMALDKWMEQADKALYLAKQSGRDCTRIYQ